MVRRSIFTSQIDMLRTLACLEGWEQPSLSSFGAIKEGVRVGRARRPAYNPARPQRNSINGQKSARLVTRFALDKI